MAVVKINERTVVQKIKRLVLGDKKPSLYTRISVMIAFTLWLYFTVWQALILMSILLVDRLKNPEMIMNTLNRVGAKYAFMHRWGLDTTKTLVFYSVVVLFFYMLSLLGIVSAYKRNKKGFLMYLFSYSLSVVFTIVFLGIDYFNEQKTQLNYLICCLLYFNFNMLFAISRKNNFKFAEPTLHLY